MEYTSGFSTPPATLVPINKIGGTYSTNATTLGQFTVPKTGVYLISAYGYFDRLNEGTAGYETPATTNDTYLQLTVRGRRRQRTRGHVLHPGRFPEGLHRDHVPVGPGHHRHRR